MRTIAVIVGFAALALGGAAPAETLKGPTGPYPVVMDEDPTLPGHTVYRPADLSRVKGTVPFIAWGNGGCANVGGMYQTFLGEIASRGYVVTAPGPIARPAAPAAGPRAQSKPGQMLDAIAWAQREAARPGSRYRGKLDATRIAVAGHSCGGLEAIAAASDARVDTALVLNSGVIRGGIPTPDGGTRQPAGYLPAGEADLPKLRVPMLYIAGGPRDQAHRGAEVDFQQITRVPVFNANLDVGHGGTWSQPQGGTMGKAALAWLDWRLKGDETAGRMFLNPTCGLCTDPQWIVKKKGMG